VLHACAGYIQEYLFTDVSPAFRAHARGLDGHGATLSFQTLDIEREPSPATDQFDLVIAVNVLHATRDLGASLRHLSQVAAPGALVLIVEPVERRTWVDLTFGLTEGWWRFEDRDLRGDYPLLDRARWLDLLAKSGFHRLSALSPADDGFHLLLPQVLFTAHQASSAPSEWEFIDASEAAIDRTSAPADLLRMFRAAGNPLLTALKEGQKKRLCVVTRGALPADGSPRLESLPQSILAGLANVARLELPSLELRHIDLDPDAHRPNLEPDSPGFAGEPIVAYRNGRRMVPRLTRVPAAQRPSLPIRQDATYLVAGGTSGLGLLAAQWLTGRGASQVLITGRRDMPAADLAAFPQIRFVPGDVTDPAHWDGLQREFPSIAGVVLAAGVLDDGVIPHLDWARFEHVLAPKTLGAWNLFRTLRKPLDWVVLYSSAVSVLGNPGQANHAAANSFLDAFVHILRSAGTPAVAINWGPVAGAAQGSGRAASLRGVGIEPLPKERVFDVLDRISLEGPAQIGVFQADWDSTEGRAPLLRNLRASPAAPIPARSALPPLEHLDCEDRKSAVRHYLRAEIAAVLGMEGPGSVDERRGFFDLGMDSLGALELRGRLEKAFAIAVPATFVFRFPTVPKLTQWLLEALGFPASPLEQSPFAAAASPSSHGAEQLTNLIETELNLWERREIHN
jgi:microcystin synthetase protein McyD